MIRKETLAPPAGSGARQARWTSAPAVVITYASQDFPACEAYGDIPERSTFMPLCALRPALLTARPSCRDGTPSAAPVQHSVVAARPLEGGAGRKACQTTGLAATPRACAGAWSLGSNTA